MARSPATYICEECVFINPLLVLEPHCLRRIYLYCDHYLSLMSRITPSLSNAILKTSVSISGGRLAASMLRAPIAALLVTSIVRCWRVRTLLSFVL
jgi:hypothetical protein